MIKTKIAEQTPNTFYPKFVITDNNFNEVVVVKSSGELPSSSPQSYLIEPLGEVGEDATLYYGTAQDTNYVIYNKGTGASGSVGGILLDGFSLQGVGTQADPLRYGGTPQNFILQGFDDYGIVGTVNAYELDWEQSGGFWIDGVTISSVNGTAVDINTANNSLVVGGTNIGVTRIYRDINASSITGLNFTESSNLSPYRLTTATLSNPPVTGLRYEAPPAT